MDKAEFFALCQENRYTPDDNTLFQKAIEFAAKVLAGVKRLAGDSCFDHNLRVASILVENKSPSELIIAGLLQSTLKHSSDEEVEKNFGAEVVTLLQGLEELKALKVRNKMLQAENLRKILLTGLKDIRVIILKLATKVDNLETAQVFSPQEQQHMAEEVLDIYAPLASRLGLERIKTCLEDLAFKIINLKEYQRITEFLEESREERDQDVEHAIEDITAAVGNSVNILKIKGRPKHIYSIYKKARDRGVPLEKQFDLLGIRILVTEEKECYTLLGLLHEKFEPVEGRLKDYITNPKPNLYRSIHTAIMIRGKKVEVQIRTPEMDEIAEEGIAAHWQYKGVKSDQLFEKKVGWLREVLELQKNGGNKEFLETITVDLFGDTIYCYTPKGDVKELPKGGTLLDFAYLIHQDIGDHCIGGKVNGKFVPLKEELRMGDVVEILTNKNQRPRRSWLKIVYSARAKQKIRKSLKEHELLPALHYKTLKPVTVEEEGVLVQAPEFTTSLCVLAKCCLAIPPEEIVGIVTKKRVISVHRKDCSSALKEEERWIDVKWKETFNQKIRFYVEAEERSGILADTLHTIASSGFEVKEAKAKLLDVRRVQCSFLLVPRDVEQLIEMIKRVQKVKGVKKLYFE